MKAPFVGFFWDVVSYILPVGKVVFFYRKVICPKGVIFCRLAKLEVKFDLIRFEFG